MNRFTIIFYCHMFFNLLSVAPIIGGIIAGVVLMAAVCMAILLVRYAYIRGSRRKASEFITVHVF